MQFKWIILIFAVHMLAANLGFAQNAEVSLSADEIRFEQENLGSSATAEDFFQEQQGTPQVSVQKIAEECVTVLPQLEEEYQNIDKQSRASDKVTSQTYRNYVSSFNDMTQVLFDLAQAKRDELARINEAEQSLKNSLATFNDKKNAQNSKELQDQYMSLTVRLYSSAVDGQKTIDQLKKSLAQVESARAQHDALKQAPVDLENKKLELEGKIVSLKIRCRK